MPQRVYLPFIRYLVCDGVTNWSTSAQREHQRLTDSIGTLAPLLYTNKMCALLAEHTPNVCASRTLSRPMAVVLKRLKCTDTRTVSHVSQQDDDDGVSLCVLCARIVND